MGDDGLAVREAIFGAFSDLVSADGLNSRSCTKVCDEFENVARSSMTSVLFHGQDRVNEEMKSRVNEYRKIRRMVTGAQDTLDK